MTAPTLSGESIICVSWLNWDWLPLVPHQMMTRFAERNRVLFVDPAIALSTFLAHPDQSPYLTGKISRWLKGLRKISENFHVFYPPPLLLTSGHLRLNDVLNRRWLGSAVRRAAARLDMRNPILWLYDPYLIEPNGQFGEKLVCYDCNDDISSFSLRAYKRRNMQDMETALATRADLVLATSRGLYNKNRALNENVHYLPSGVDFDLFNSSVHAELPPPEELRDVSSPVVGYVGALTNYRIEWEWLEALARRMPEVTLVLVGPPIEPLPRSVIDLPNVRFVGSKPPAELPRYLRMFDVGIIPYKGEAFLKGCQPTKTFEYLAAGLGVVSAPIPELEPFAAVVRIAASASEFVEQTRAMLLRVQDADFRRQCVETARDKTWNARVAAASDLVRTMLARKADAVTAPRG